MPLDPQTKALLELGAALPPVESLTVEEARASLAERALLTAGPPQPVADVSDETIPGPAGDIPIRVYTPDASPPLPGLVYFHGGGWITGGLGTHDVACRALANGGMCVVVSVDYRLAPEHRFPAAIDDAEAATRWVAANAAQLHIDPERIAVAGDSAGGNLAAAVALSLRDAGGPRLAYQLLIYPVTDYNFETRSYIENGVGYRLTRSTMEYYWSSYVRDAAEAADQRASPLRATDVAGVPPALVVTAEFDPLRDEGRAYAERLQAAGVPVEYREYAGLIHGFVSHGGMVDRAREALHEIALTLREALSAVPAR
jgi:acetyl esterase